MTFTCIQFPIQKYEKYIELAAINFKIFLIEAETGSGKTSFVPAILYKKNIFNSIVISQTKRVAVISIAKYVAKKLNLSIGKEIGYTIRFEDKSNTKTKIKFVTDGILFKESLENTILTKYNCIILDEFHERTIYTDLLLANLKKSIVSKNSFCIIIMSAFGKYDEVAKFFNTSIGKIIIPGRLFDIKLFYTKISQRNYLVSISAFITEYHLNNTMHDGLLIFLPGQNEIQKIEKQLMYLLKKKLSTFIIIKFYSKISKENYPNIFENKITKKRRIILTTNIAESSVTIPGINVVIDSGLSKKRITNWKNDINLFRCYSISKSEAFQRAGRTGRESTGKCFRMFTFENFCKFRLHPKPAIQQIELTWIILQLYSSKITRFFELDFITMPPIWSVCRSLEKLFTHGIISNKLRITFLGKMCSTFPLDINLSIAVIYALKQKNKILLDLILSTVSMLATNIIYTMEKNIFFISTIQDRLKTIGDYFFYTIFFYEYHSNKYFKFLKIQQDKKSVQECMRIAFLVKKQIKEMCLILNSLINSEEITCISKNADLKDQFKICFTAGYFLHATRFLPQFRKYQNIYCGLITSIYPCSVYHSKYPRLVIFHEFLITSIQYIKIVTPVHLKWVYLFGQKIFT